MRGVRVIYRCEPCVHYELEGISHRCTHMSNTYNTWMGITYKLHPDMKNRRRRCEHYEEAATESSTSNPNGTVNGVQTPGHAEDYDPARRRI
jgi:hypothetical protein